MLLGLLSIAGGSGCSGSQSELWGSIATSFSLTFDDLRAFRLGDDLVIAYQQAFDPPNLTTSIGKPIMNQPVRLTFSWARFTWEVERPIRFDGAREGPPIGFVERYVVEPDDDRRLVQAPGFPTLEKGEVTFEIIGQQALQRVKGTFDCWFVNQRTLGGSFDVILTEP